MDVGRMQGRAWSLPASLDFLSRRIKWGGINLSVPSANCLHPAHKYLPFSLGHRVAEQGQGSASGELGSSSGSNFDKIFGLSKSLLFSVPLGPVLRVVVKLVREALDSAQGLQEKRQLPL